MSGVYFFVRSSKTKSLFDKSLPAFESLVQSYTYIGDDPEILHKSPQGVPRTAGESVL